MAEHEPLGGGGTNIQRSLPLLRAHCARARETTHAAATMQRFALEVDPPFLLDVARVFVPALAGGGGESPRTRLADDLRLVPGETHRLRPGELSSCARRGASSPTAHPARRTSSTAAAAPSSSTAAVTREFERTRP